MNKKNKEKIYKLINNASYNNYSKNNILSILREIIK